MRIILTCAAVAACTACQPAAEKPASVDTTAESQAIEKAEQAQIAAINAHDLSGATSVYGEDAVFVGDDGVAVKGKDAISNTFKGFMADPTVKIDYTPGAKTFSAGGDMAYSTAAFSETYTDPKTKQPVSIKGTNSSVWQKQSDGNWKLVVDSNPAAKTE